MANNTNNQNRLLKVNNKFHYQHMHPYIALLNELTTEMDSLIKEWDKTPAHEVQRQMKFVSAYLNKVTSRLKSLHEDMVSTTNKKQHVNIDVLLWNFVLDFPEISWEIDYDTDYESFKECGFKVPTSKVPTFKNGLGWKEYLQMIAKQKADYESVDAFLDILPEDIYMVCEALAWNAVYNCFNDEDIEHYIQVTLSADAKSHEYIISIRSDYQEKQETPIDTVSANGVFVWCEEELEQIIPHYGGHFEINNYGDVLSINIYLPFNQVQP